MTIDPAVLVERLATHRAIGASPAKELAWLVENSTFRQYYAGERIADKGDAVNEMFVVLSGHGAVYIDRGAGRRKFFEWGPGDVTGLMPFSRLRESQGQAVMDQAADVLVLHRDRFPEFIRECPIITERLVHAMVDRARHFTSADSQDEKMVSLGRLAAGLAHELNNPASAAERGAQTLAAVLTQANEAAIDLARERLTDAEYDAIVSFRAEAQLLRSTDAASALDLADREDAIAEWLDDNDIDPSQAQALAEAGFTPSRLDELCRLVPERSLEKVVRWVTTDFAAHVLANDVERAAHRIYDLVSAVKRFTYMDRAGVSAPVSVASTIADTVTVLGAKAKAKNVVVRMDVPQSLPMIDAFGAELNQVWSNLIDNALDAANTAGHVEITAGANDGAVVVRVIDDGSGISDADLPRVFDPFFTTKPVGQGTGLGLDIARRIVRRHDGQIEVDSRPGRTEFRVTLPIRRAAAL